MKGREPIWNVFAGLDAGLWTELVPMSSKDRLVLPVVIRRRLPFLKPQQSTEVLAVLGGDGSVRVVPLAVEGEDMLGQVCRIISDADADARPDLILAAMSVYVRLSVEPTGRFVIPDGLAVHLAASIETPVRVVVRDGGLHLWREAAWLACQAERIERLRGRLDAA